jgi:hypothetical protein
MNASSFATRPPDPSPEEMRVFWRYFELFKGLDTSVPAYVHTEQSEALFEEMKVEIARARGARGKG